MTTPEGTAPVVRKNAQRSLPFLPGVGPQGSVCGQDDVLGLAELQEFALVEVRVTFHPQSAKQEGWISGPGPPN